MNYLRQLFENTELFSIRDTTGKIVSEGVNNILIICNGTNEEKNLLAKILGSVKLNLSDVVLVNSENAVAFHRLKRAGFKKLLLLGATPSEIGLNIIYSNYTPIYFQDVQILASESLALLEKTKSSKDLLWKALRKMFP